MGTSALKYAQRNGGLYDKPLRRAGRSQISHNTMRTNGMEQPQFRRCECRACQKLFRTTRKSTQKYCNSACKQKAYRERFRNQHPLPPVRRYPILKGDDCKYCGAEIYTARPKHRKYCCFACSQAAYRQRKAERQYVYVGAA